MRVTPCVRFALILAVLFTRTVSLHPSGMPAEEKQDETPAAAPAAAQAAPPLVSIVKDTKNVRTQDFLLLLDLDDITGCRDDYLRSRNEWPEYFDLLRILDPLIDYAAARNGVPWAAQDPVVLDVHDGVGEKSGVARVVTGESRETIRLRAEHVLKAFIPNGTYWKRELVTFSKKRPILGFIKDLDDTYLAVDRSDFLNAQAAFFGFRWQIDAPMRAFNREFNRLGAEYDKLNDNATDMDAEFTWEQYEIAVTTVNSTNPAAGLPFFASDFESRNTKRQVLEKAGKKMTKASRTRLSSTHSSYYM